MSEFSQQLVSVQNHVDFFAEQMEALGNKVECLEACAEGDDFNEEDYEPEDDGVGEEVQRLQDDVALASEQEPQRPPRVSRRSAAAVLGNHGKGPMKKPKTGA